MNHTTNLHLPQWEADDRIMRTDFNEAFAKIDEGMSGGLKVETGSYIGNGLYGAEHPNTLTFDFAPKLVIVIPGAAINTIWNTPLLMIRGCEASPVFYNDVGYSDPLKPQYNVVQWGESSVSWHGSVDTTLSNFARLQFNWNGQPYFFAAFG